MNNYMKNVKVATSIKGAILTITLREAVAKGEKFDTEKHDTYATMDFDTTLLAESVKDYAVMHGVKQKLIDNLAFTAEAKEKKTSDDAKKMTEELWKQLLDGHWNAPTRASKEPTVKLSDMELKFLDSVKAGLTTYEQAKTLYFSLTGLQLPEPPEADEESDDNEDSDNN